MSFTTGPRNLSAAVLSPNSVHLTWAAPCHTRQYHIYYRGACGAYVDEGRLDTDHQKYAIDSRHKLQFHCHPRLGSVEVECSLLAQYMQEPSQQVAKYHECSF